jgi:hypothetical protein
LIPLFGWVWEADKSIDVLAISALAWISFARMKKPRRMTAGDGQYQREGSSGRKVLPGGIPTVVEFAHIRSGLKEDFEISGGNNP